MVTGPMPRNPNATSPNANTGAGVTPPGPVMKSIAVPSVLTRYASPMRPMITRPIQYAEKLPATKPEMMLSDAPASFDAVTTSRTWPESTDVKTLITSGRTAPASVPQLMIAESFHQSVPSPRPAIVTYETTNVSAIETIDVSHTRNVSGCSKFILSTVP